MHHEQLVVRGVDLRGNWQHLVFPLDLLFGWRLILIRLGLPRLATGPAPAGHLRLCSGIVGFWVHLRRRLKWNPDSNAGLQLVGSAVLSSWRHAQVDELVPLLELVSLDVGVSVGSSVVEVPEAFKDHVENILLDSESFSLGGQLAQDLVSEQLGSSVQFSHLGVLVLLEVLSRGVERQWLSQAHHKLLVSSANLQVHFGGSLLLTDVAQQEVLHVRPVEPSLLDVSWLHLVVPLNLLASEFRLLLLLCLAFGSSTLL